MHRKWLLPILIALITGMLALPGVAQERWDDYEWEPDEGLHEEEWYDPTDWLADDAEDAPDIEYDVGDFYPYGEDYASDAWPYTYDTYDNTGYYEGLYSDYDYFDDYGRLDDVPEVSDYEYYDDDPYDVYDSPFDEYDYTDDDLGYDFSDYPYQGDTSYLPGDYDYEADVADDDYIEGFDFEDDGAIEDYYFDDARGTLDQEAADDEMFGREDETWIHEIDPFDSGYDYTWSMEEGYVGDDESYEDYEYGYGY